MRSRTPGAFSQLSAFASLCRQSDFTRELALAQFLDIILKRPVGGEHRNSFLTRIVSERSNTGNLLCSWVLGSNGAEK
jgi:hypothetical protein